MNAQKVVQSQYLAALKMLKEAIRKSPADIWNARQDADRFWFKAQHTLYWTHRYLHAADKRFAAWRGHQKPRADAPVSKADLLEYAGFIEQQLARHMSGRVSKTPAPDNRFDISGLEHHIINIRHIQQHAGELYERLGTRAGATLHWTETVSGKTK
jgi:hypothetical protein